MTSPRDRRNLTRGWREYRVLKIAKLSQEEIVSEARDLFTRSPTLGHDECRRIVEAITERITIGTDDIAIDLFDAPVQLEAAATSLSAY